MDDMSHLDSDKHFHSSKQDWQWCKLVHGHRFSNANNRFSQAVIYCSRSGEAESHDSFRTINYSPLSTLIESFSENVQFIGAYFLASSSMGFIFGMT